MKFSPPNNNASLYIDETKTGLRAFFEADIPTKMSGRITGKLKTGAKYPAPSALEETAPMKV